LPVVLGHSDTPGAYPCWNLMVLVCRFPQLPLLLSICRLIVEFFPWL
jgi:hypothetical protein